MNKPIQRSWLSRAFPRSQLLGQDGAQDGTRRMPHPPLQDRAELHGLTVATAEQLGQGGTVPRPLPRGSQVPSAPAPETSRSGIPCKSLAASYSSDPRLCSAKFHKCVILRGN